MFMNPSTWPPSPSLLAPLAPWFDACRRDLPWRAQDLNQRHPNPYAVLVSELMLQQTQVATVIPYFEKWMIRFPNPKTLAAATEDEVHKAWEGLGYYRRARHLQAAARIIAETGWPADLEGLLELPGLGPYTGAAVASIAFQWPEPALDGNAFRVLARLLALEGDPKVHATALRTWLRQTLFENGPSRMTQALMELGATLCGSSPRCETCPVARGCQARKQGLQGVIPPPAKRAAPKRIELMLLAVEVNGQFLLQPPSGKGLLAGLWTWPSLTQEVSRDLAAEGSAAYGVDAQTWPSWTQVYTHRREEVEPLHLRFEVPFEAPPGTTWLALESLAEIPMGNRDSRLRTLLGTPGQAPILHIAANRIMACVKERGASPAR